MTRPPILGTLESALYSPDLSAATDFWERIIGLERIAMVENRHIFYRLGSGVLLIFRAEATAIPPPPDARLPVPPHGTTGPGHFCMAVQGADLDAWRLWLQQHGITIESDFTWPQGGRSIYFRDPAGNSIEMADPCIWDR